jgi:peptide/nickel transport system substrate-binding protein
VVETLFSANYPQATSVVASTAAGYVNLSDKLAFDPPKQNSCLMMRAETGRRRYPG